MIKTFYYNERENSDVKITIDLTDECHVDFVQKMFNTFDPYVSFIDDYGQYLSTQERNKLILKEIDVCGYIIMEETNLYGK
jgi:hypothetical protein